MTSIRGDILPWFTGTESTETCIFRQKITYYNGKDWGKAFGAPYWQDSPVFPNTIPVAVYLAWHFLKSILYCINHTISDCKENQYILALKCLPSSCFSIIELRRTTGEWHTGRLISFTLGTFGKNIRNLQNVKNVIRWWCSGIVYKEV
jgi:hypothetical protein